MSKSNIINAVFNGLVRLVKAINCKIKCCCESECSQQNPEPSSPAEFETGMDEETWNNGVFGMETIKE